MDSKSAYLQLVVCALVAFCAIRIITAHVIADNPLDDSGLNANVWQDLPLESDDKSPIVLIAKPFVAPSSLQADGSPNATAPHAVGVGHLNLTQPEDFFATTATVAANQVLKNADPDGRTNNTKNASTPFPDSSFSSSKFGSFRKKFFSRLIPL